MEEEPALDFSAYHIHPNDLQEAMKAFRWFHSRRTGLLRPEDLPKVLESMGLKIQKEEVFKLLSLTQFLNMVLRKVHQLNMHDDLMALFHLYDLDRKGRLSYEEMHFLSTKLLGDLNLSPDQVEEFIKRSDTDTQGLVDYKSFVKLLTDSL
jgi:Ca2+-binding EF-hand superfamily protein